MRAPAKKKKSATNRPEKKKGPAKAPVLVPAERKRLAGLAHSFEPVVQVGRAGITDGVVAAVSQALLDHELIKVRLHEPEDKHALSSELATRSLSALCGLIGHTVILYKPHPSHPKVASKKRAGEAKSAPRKKR